MVQNTARLILCLILAGHVLKVNADLTTPYKECEAKEFGRCAYVLVDAYRNADKKENLINIYCNAYKEFGRCLISNPACVGNLIDLTRFAALQHMFLDRILGICTKTDLQPFNEIVHANEKYRIKSASLKYLDTDRFETCTAKTNIYCASRLAEEIRSGGNPCDAYLKFYDCYSSKPMSCNDKIYQDYLADIWTGKSVVKFAKEFPELFPC